MPVDLLWATLAKSLPPIFADYRSRIADVAVEIKSDRTLLTEADVRIQDLIVATIRAQEPDAVIIAEEDEREGIRTEVAESRGRIWVIDPIDGTAQFVRPDQAEFCSVVCLLEAWQPAQAFVLAPELGIDGDPLVVIGEADSLTVSVNGVDENSMGSKNRSRWLSLTRSSSEAARSIETVAARSGFYTKTSTTSQTIDMVRTAVDISSVTSPSLPSFSLFWRRDQKLWDGAAGLCLARAAGLRTCNETGEPLLLEPEWLSQPCPIFDSTLVGRQETVDWFIGSYGACVPAKY